MLSRMQFKGVWRDYQSRLLAEMESHLGDARLHVVAAPGAGKTILGLEIVRRLGRRAIIFTPTVAIRDQWADRLVPLFLDARPAMGETSHQLTAPEQMTLVTYQALDALRRSGGIEDVVKALRDGGPVTLVLDEAHHLRREWWRCLEQLASALPDVRVVALTATPPYDSSYAEWAKYEGLCGPIDLEIGIPELVRNGDLCPHQDHVILSAPTDDTLQLLDSRAQEIGALQQDLRADASLLDYLAAHPWLTRPDDHIDAILEAPEMLSAVLVLLASAGRRLPRAPLKLLGVAARDIPAPSMFWLERFLDGVTGKLSAIFKIGDERLADLRRRLHRQGLIEGGRVRLFQTRSIFQLLASSLAKLQSISEIARAEEASLGTSLRMVILSDHIRAEEFPDRPGDEFQPAKLGVVPIFEHLRRQGIAPDALGILTGTLVVIPRSILPIVRGVAASVGIEPSGIQKFDMLACPGHVRLEVATGGTAALVRLVTALFAQGAIRILVGTQSLLGEGWDAPSLNSLILASNTASFMLSNQMRGRAIRIDPDSLGKVSNIWHLATIEPVVANGFAATAQVMNWGYLGDGGPEGMSDVALLQRRFRAFEGISNGPSLLIGNGIARLGIDPSQDLSTVNAQTLATAADRMQTARKWSESLGRGGKHAHVRETAAPSYAPQMLSRFDTIHALCWSGLGSGLWVAANKLRHINSMHDLGVAGMAIAGAATLASLPKLARAARLVWRNGSIEGSLEQVGQVVLAALHHTKLVSDEDRALANFQVRSAIDGRKDIILLGTSRTTERKVMQAISEVLGPIQNPRYILLRRSWLGSRRRTDYHAVPDVLGEKKAWAEHFAKLWATHIGQSTLVYTRTAGGRRTLLRARARSLSAGFQRSVERRSAWL